jgi:hypothetical protein
LLLAWLPDSCLWTAIGIVLISLGFGVYLLIQDWWEKRLRQQYCPECGHPAPIIGRDTHCLRCGCEYDKFGNLIAEAPARPEWDRVDLNKFNDSHHAAQDDPRFSEKDGYHGESHA